MRDITMKKSVLLEKLPSPVGTRELVARLGEPFRLFKPDRVALQVGERLSRLFDSDLNLGGWDWSATDGTTLLRSLPGKPVTVDPKELAAAQPIAHTLT